jgi:hypothetical protein
LKSSSSPAKSASPNGEDINRCAKFAICSQAVKLSFSPRSLEAPPR